MSEEVLIALSDLANGAINHYKTIITVMKKKNIVENYIEQLQQEIRNLKEIEEEHRRLNGELKEQNKCLQGRIEYLERSISRKEDIILDYRVENIGIVNKLENWLEESRDAIDGLIDVTKSDIEEVKGTLFAENILNKLISENEIALKTLNKVLDKLKELKESDE